MAGCEAIHSRPPAVAVPGARRRRPVPTTAQGQPQETWEAVYLNERRGRARLDQDHERRRTRADAATGDGGEPSGRGPQRAAPEIVIATTSTETFAGELLHFQTEIRSGTSSKTVAGRVNDGQLTLTTTTAGKTDSASAAWTPGTGGINAIEQSLLSRPMQPGEGRRRWPSIRC